MSIIEEMEIVKWAGRPDWDDIIHLSTPYIGPQRGIIIPKSDDLPHPKDHFKNIYCSFLFAMPERRGSEISWTSWRIRDYPGKGYHVHEFYEYYQLHCDIYDPKDLESTTKHVINDTSVSEKILILAAAAAATTVAIFGIKKLVDYIEDDER